MRIILSLSFAGALAFTPGWGADPSQAENVSIEVSMGGVSLGAYQGGYLYGQALRFQSDTAVAGSDTAMQYQILTGASAGAINSMGGLYYAFHKQRDDGWSPFKSWLGIGWENLIQKPVRHGHLFETKAIENALDSVLNAALTPPDKVNSKNKIVWLGFASTRFQPRPLKAGNIESKKLDEKFVVGIQWLTGDATAHCPERGKECWRAWTQVPQTTGKMTPHLFLYFGKYGTDLEKIRGNLRDLVLASSAFPVAFPRHRVKVVLIDSGDLVWYARDFGRAWTSREAAKELMLTQDSADKAGNHLHYQGTGDPALGKWEPDSLPNFSDGGLFENEPLNLARRIWDDLRKNPQNGVQAARSLRFLRPMQYDPLFADGQQKRIYRSETSEWIRFFTDRKSAGTESRDINEFIEKVDISPERIHLSNTSLPLAGEHVTHFSAFMRQEFRDFDFVVGLHDGLCGEQASNCKREKLAEFLPSSNDSLLLRHVLTISGHINRIYSGDPQQGAAGFRQVSAINQDSTKLDSAISYVKEIQDTLFQTIPKGDQAYLQAMYGSLERLRRTLEAHRDSKDESGSDQFKHFAWGYGVRTRKYDPSLWNHRLKLDPRWLTAQAGNYGSLDKVELGTAIADPIYSAIDDLLAEDELGRGNSSLYPLVRYHARAGMGAYWGITPTFHTRFVQFEGATGGMRALVGLPLHAIPIFKDYPIVVELGAHFFDGDFARYHGRLFAEINDLWWVQLAGGAVVEGKSDFAKWRGWPRFEIIGFDVLVLGMDFNDNSRGSASGFHVGKRIPAFSGGIRIGYDILAFCKGSFRGNNDTRTYPESKGN